MEIMILPFLKLIAQIYTRLPRSVALKLGSGLGILLSWTKIRSRVVEENLKIAFPKNLDEQRRLFHEAYRHLGHLVFEVISVLGPLRKFILKHSELQGLENWQEAQRQGKGVVFLASHVGNWEVMAATGSVLGGIDLMIVTKHLKPEWLHQAIEKGRARCGVRATYEPKTLRDVLSHLKKGGTVGFVLDQYAGPPVGIRVPVFGIPVGTSTAIAMLVKRTGAAILPVVSYRKKNGKFVVDIRPPLTWKEQKDSEIAIAANTASYAQELEKDIYSYPEQWLWIHRRFKGDLSPLRDEEWSQGRLRS